MRAKEAIAAALHLLVVLFCCAPAALLFLLPLRPDWRLLAVRWLEEDPTQFYWIGGTFVLAGLFFALSFIALHRGKVTRLTVKAPYFSLDRKILKRAVDDFFTTHFPGMHPDVHLLSKDELELSLDLPAKKQSEEILKKIEEQFSLLLRERFGYDKPFTLSLRDK